MHKRIRLFGFLRESIQHRDCRNPTLDPRIVNGFAPTPLFDGVEGFDLGGKSEPSRGDASRT
jgi:hypothetical protein